MKWWHLISSRSKVNISTMMIMFHQDCYLLFRAVMGKEMWRFGLKHSMFSICSFHPATSTVCVCWASGDCRCSVSGPVRIVSEWRQFVSRWNQKCQRMSLDRRECKLQLDSSSGGKQLPGGNSSSLKHLEKNIKHSKSVCNLHFQASIPH